MTPYPQTPASDFPETVGAYPGMDWYNSLPYGQSYAAHYFTKWVVFGGDGGAFRNALALGWMTPPYRHPETGKIYQIFCHREDILACYGYHYPRERHDYTDLRFTSGDYYCRTTRLDYVGTGEVVRWTDANAGSRWHRLQYAGDPPEARPEELNVASTCNPSGSGGYTHFYTWELALYGLRWYLYEPPLKSETPPGIIPIFTAISLLGLVGIPPFSLLSPGCLLTAGSTNPSTPARRRRKS